MDGEARDDIASPRQNDLAQQVDGISVVSFRDVVRRLRADYPTHDAGHIEAIVLREWEAFSAGRPLVVPAAVEEGAREILDLPPV